MLYLVYTTKVDGYNIIWSAKKVDTSNILVTSDSVGFAEICGEITSHAIPLIPYLFLFSVLFSALILVCVITTLNMHRLPTPGRCGHLMLSVRNRSHLSVFNHSDRSFDLVYCSHQLLISKK